MNICRPLVLYVSKDQSIAVRPGRVEAVLKVQHKGIMHSGTARIGRVRMATMSLYETGDSSGAVVDDDMYKVDGVKRDSGKVWSLIRSLGRNESTIVSNSTLRKDMGAMDELTIDPDMQPCIISEMKRVMKRMQ